MGGGNYLSLYYIDIIEEGGGVLCEVYNICVYVCVCLGRGYEYSRVGVFRTNRKTKAVRGNYCSCMVTVIKMCLCVRVCLCVWKAGSRK